MPSVHPFPCGASKCCFVLLPMKAEDKAITLALASGSGPAADQQFAARHTPKDGVWIVEIDADAALADRIAAFAASRFPRERCNDLLCPRRRMALDIANASSVLP